MFETLSPQMVELMPVAYGHGQMHAPGDWKARAVAEYHRRREHESEDLRAALAQRLRALAGPDAAIRHMWADVAERTAGASLDGILFRLEGGKVVLLRPCAVCGQGHIASPPIRTRADLGYALDGWRPRHAACLPEDEPWVD